MADEGTPQDPKIVEFKDKRPAAAPASTTALPKKIIGVRLDVTRLLKAPTIPVRWLVDGMTPEKAIGLWSGAGGIGKSYVLMEMALALASGRPLFNHFSTGRPRRVGYFDLEMMKEETSRRFQRMLKGQGETNWDNLHLFAQGNILLDEDHSPSKAILNEMIGDLKLEVVIIDSLRRMHLGEDADSRQSNRIFNILKEMRDRHGVSFQVIAHWRKAKGSYVLDSPAERLSGSADWRNFVDSHISVVKHRTENHMLLYPDKGRHADRVQARFAVKFEHVKVEDPDGPFQLTMADDAEQQVGKSNHDRVLDHLMVLGRATTVKEIAEVLGIRRTSVDRVVKKMEDHGDVRIDKKSKPWKVALTEPEYE